MPKLSTQFCRVQQTNETYFRYTEPTEHLKVNECNLPHQKKNEKGNQ